MTGMIEGLTYELRIGQPIDRPMEGKDGPPGRVGRSIAAEGTGAWPTAVAPGG